MIKLQLNIQNPLSIIPIMASEWKICDIISIETINYLPQGNMENVDANVGDVSRVLQNELELVITSDLSQTSKLILRKDLKLNEIKSIMASREQSLGVYTDIFLKQNKMENVEILPVADPIKRDQNLKNQEVDGAMFIDPYTFGYEDNYKTVFSGRESGYNFTCWFFKKEFVDKNEEQVKQFNKALNETIVKFNNLTKVDKLELCRKHLIIKEGYEDYYENLTFDLMAEYKDKDLIYINEWMTKRGFLKQQKNLKQIIYRWE